MDDKPKKEIHKLNEEAWEMTMQDFKEFREDFQHDICNICKAKLDYFNPDQPCMHWLLMPQGIQKKHFPVVFNAFPMSRIRSFLRWIANSDTIAKNINDLTDEQNPRKYIEETIKLKDLEWSFSCDKNDFKGHKNKRFGKEPHYHFQMRIKGRSFIDFTDYHLPLTQDDIKAINAQRGLYKGFGYSHGPGAGLQEFIERTGNEKFIENLQAAPEEDATVHLQTMIEADEGTTINGDDIADIMEEHKRTGIPMATLIQKIPNIKQTTYIVPSDNLPEMASRKKRKNR